MRVAMPVRSASSEAGAPCPAPHGAADREAVACHAAKIRVALRVPAAWIVGG